MGGGILTLVGSHIIDLLSHLTGLKATRFVKLDDNSCSIYKKN